MDKYRKFKLECMRLARISWRINQHPPFVVGFKDGENFMMVMPPFIYNQAMLITFLETISSEEDWDAIALFNFGGSGSMVITLLVGDKLMTTSADIIDDYGAAYLSDFSEWQDLGSSNNITLSHCISRDVVNSIQKRAVNYG